MQIATELLTAKAKLKFAVNTFQRINAIDHAQDIRCCINRNLANNLEEHFPLLRRQSAKQFEARLQGTESAWHGVMARGHGTGSGLHNCINKTRQPLRQHL